MKLTKLLENIITEKFDAQEAITYMQSVIKGNVASPFLAAERGELDGIIEPSATRISVIKAMRALRTKRSNLPPKKHGNIPL